MASLYFIDSFHIDLLQFNNYYDLIYFYEKSEKGDHYFLESILRVCNIVI